MDAADAELVKRAAQMVQSAASKGREVAADKSAFDQHMSRTEDAAGFITRLPQRPHPSRG